MSENLSPNSVTTSSSSFSTSTTSTVNGEKKSFRRSQQIYTEEDGSTTVRNTTQNLGELPSETVERYDNTGRRLEDQGSQGRIEDVTDADKEYEERMEDEYAKREGGA